MTLGDPAPAVFVDPDFRITSCNEATGRLLDLDVGTLVGQPVAGLFRNPESIDSLREGQVMQPGQPTREARAVVVRGDGSFFAVRIEVLQLVDDRDRMVGYLMLIHAGIGQDTWSTERLVQQERLATMGEMAAALAHEIRNPLLAIGATLESLGREPMNDRHRRLLDSAAREIARLDLTLKKYLSQRIEMDFSAIRVSEVLSDVRRLLAGTRKQQGKNVQISVGQDVVLQADYDSLKHLFFNLILNALEVSPEGGEVTCRAEVTPSDISVFIEDRGPGLMTSTGSCFRPFFTTKKNGSGLGLPVCQRIAQAHGGLVELEPREGGGCRAVVVLPRALKQQEQGCL
jgi:signal transduction histidine kinase